MSIQNNEPKYFNKLENIPDVENKDVIPNSYIPKNLEVKKEQDRSSSNEVIVYAIRDLSKKGFVDLGRGYNVISKKDYKKWAYHNGVRLASKQEIEDNF